MASTNSGVEPDEVFDLGAGKPEGDNDGPPSHQLIINLSCPDQVGIVYGVSKVIAEAEFNIEDSQQFRDPGTERFFMRVHVESTHGSPGPDALRRRLESLGFAMSMDLEIADAGTVPKVLIMVSRLGHCLNDLLYRVRIGALRCEIGAVVSNHMDFKDLCEGFGVPFHYVPVLQGNKTESEAELTRLIAEEGIDLVVLARYMQILSPDVTNGLKGRIINIHHSFLPSFKGAKPYHQAFDRGVKIIGATAHYVTEDLDEGPIIEQQVERVDHSTAPLEMAAIGRDLESSVLARAVKWHLERRILLNGKRTVVFR